MFKFFLLQWNEVTLTLVEKVWEHGSIARRKFSNSIQIWFFLKIFYCYCSLMLPGRKHNFHQRTLIEVTLQMMMFFPDLIKQSDILQFWEQGLSQKLETLEIWRCDSNYNIVEYLSRSKAYRSNWGFVI